MASCGEQSSENRCQQLKSQSTWCGMTTNAQMGPLSCHGPEESQWPGTWQYQTHMLSLTLAKQQLNQVQQPKDSAEQDRQILQISQHAHLLPICYRNSWYMAWDGHWAYTRDCQAYTTITEVTRETTFLFQRLSMVLQTGNAVSFHSTMVTE